MKELFEQPERYDEYLQKGIGITGEDKDFFIRGRLRLMLDKMQHAAPLRILDFGCGTGATALHLARLFPNARIYATDHSRAAIGYALAGKHPQSVEFQYFDEWEKGKDLYDLVYINCVFHHIEPAKRQTVVDLLFSRMAPKGELWIFENNPLNPGTRMAMYLNPFDKGVQKIWPSELVRRVAEAGFRQKGIWFLFYFPKWLSAFRFLEKYWLRLPLGGQYAVQADKG